MKNIVLMFDIIVQLTLLVVLLFNRKIYLHCIELDN